MMILESQLADIEAIKQLKARYPRFADTKQWDEFAELFAEDVDVVMELYPRPSKDHPMAPAHFKGRDALIAGNAPNLVGVTTIHNVYSAEIEIMSSTEAKGIWSMQVKVISPHLIFNGWGFYHELYVKIGDSWKFKKIHLTAIHVEEQWVSLEG
jgi:hypothetical protein